jgi:branched-subunit amino acid aminotransferase/4-amino-4-deoxychorismate lyase
MSFVYYQGQYHPAETPLFTAADRSYRFGDGIFETLLVYNGRLFEPAIHFARLRKGLAYFRLALEEADKLEELCAALLIKNALHTGYVRLVVSRGENPPDAVGYLPKHHNATLLMQTFAKQLPALKKITLWQSSIVASMIAPCKTNSALPYVMAMLEAEQNTCDNAVLCDASGRICETASGNLFWITGETLYTPSLDLPLVAGTVRHKILTLWQGKIAEGHYRLDVFQEADEIFMSNIGTLIAPIAEIRPLGIIPKQEKHALALREQLVAAIIHEL